MTTNRKSKVILDTNIWISFLITKTFSKLDHFIQQGKIQLLFSNESLSEFIEVTARPKFKKYFTIEDIIEAIDYMDQYGTIIKVKSQVDLCRDKKDNFWLELAKDGKADYLVTGDDDLLTLKSFGQTRILKFKDYLNELT